MHAPLSLKPAMRHCVTGTSKDKKMTGENNWKYNLKSK